MDTKSGRLGKYEMQQRLAQGGMGEVWKALDTQLQRLVAIKLLRADLQHDPDFVVRFKREAQLIAALHHPNIVQIHDFHISYPPETEYTQAYMVMDYVQGQTMADYIRHTSRKGKFPSADDLIYLFTATSLAIDYAHSKGMIHRDIKPANILLDQRLPSARPMGEPILTDFGIARLQGASTGTVVGTLMGTPHYISPEQAQGLHGDKRSDLYSLGIILYEITTGVTPFRGDTTMAIIIQHIRSMPTPPALINPNIPPELSGLILKSIAKEPDDRFQSASEMTIALAQAMHVTVPKSLLSSNSISLPSGPADSLPPPSLSSSAGTTPYHTPVAEIQSVNPPAYYPARPVTPVAGVFGPPSTSPMESLNQARAPMIQKPAASTGTVVGTDLSRPPLTHRPPSLWSGKRRFLLLASLFFVVLLVSGAISFALFSRSNPPATADTPVGQIHFIQSGQAPAGSYNQVQIDLHAIPDPPQGKVYYAWLESASTEADRPHWPLTVNNGTVHATNLNYSGYPNLLLPNRILLITTESNTTPPIVPYPYSDPNAPRYYAILTPTSATTFDIKKCTVSISACSE